MPTKKPAAPEVLSKHVADITQYVEGILSGEIPACKWVKLACQRHLNDLSAAESGGDFPYRFDPASADRAIRFIELLPHVTGRWAAARELLRLEPWQKFIVGSIFGWVKKHSGKRRFRIAYCCIPRKNAKALALDTPIPTPTGWTTMGEVSVGDYVLGTDGAPRKVIAATEVMYDQTCYRVAFSNGESLIADAGHLWQTDTRTDRDKRPGRMACPTIKTTEEIAQTLRAWDENNHRVYVPSALQLPAQHLPVSPYVLGAWLGDGHSASARITIGDQDCEQMIAEVQSEGQPIRRVKGHYLYALSDGDRNQAARDNSLAAQLRALGVLGNKHIPAIYLRASYEQRLSLLQGLMDTDGTCSKHGQCSFTTNSYALHADFMELVRTLGLKPSVEITDAKIAGKNCGRVYRVQFFAFADQRVFRLQRKAERQKATPHKLTRSRTIQIVACEKVASVPVRCIQVDHPDGMYIVGRTFVPTHNSTLAATIGLYCLIMDGEFGAQVYCGAGTKNQAHMVFDPSKEMVKRTPALMERYGVEVNATSIVVANTNSKYEPLIGKPGDGGSPSLAIVDEYHEHPDSTLYDTMKTGMGAREQPLAFVITTAGVDISGPCFAMQRDMEKMLEGVFDNPDQFAIMYTIDAEPYTFNGVEYQADDWTSEAALRKANPNWGVSVNIESILSDQREAIQSPEKQNIFKTKHMNVWCSARHGWMNMARWVELGDEVLKLSDFAGERCVMGFDLGAQIDITAAVLLFMRVIDGVQHYYCFPRFYLPENRANDPNCQSYQAWVHQKVLIATDGDETDFALIKKHVLEDAAKYEIAEFAFDKFQALNLKQQLQAEANLVTAEIPQNAVTFNDPMRWLEGMVKSGRFHHPNNPVMNWMMSNVVVREDGNEMIFPRKEKPENKIDGATALINALVCASRVFSGTQTKKKFTFTGF